MTIQPTSDDLARRIAWWSEARFGLFIHWGLYAVHEGRWNGKTIEGPGEWMRQRARLQVRDYAPLVHRFNPTEFDAAAWIRLIKEAGCRYFVITTKHHDGFSMFRSDASDFDIAATPFGQGNQRDIMRELADAARAQGLRIGWYHSILDWQHEDYLPRPDWDERPATHADFDRYVRFLHTQVRELLTRYGPIDIMWFDGEWESSWTHERGVELYKLCRSLNPDIIVNNRADKGRDGMAGMNVAGEFVGDFGTPEQEVPAEGFGPGVFWESCMTMNKAWGFKIDDNNWKSSTTLIRTLIDVASKGGNFLLNIGPHATGRIPQASVDRLGDIGRWLKINGEAIYGTQASIIGRPAWGRSTTRRLDNGQTVIYPHIFDWPEDGKLVVPLAGHEVIRAEMLGDRKVLRFQGEMDGFNDRIVVFLGDGSRDEQATVLKVIVKARP